MDQARTWLIHTLTEREFDYDIMIFHDCDRRYDMRFGGGRGYCQILGSFLPQLGKRGVVDEQIQTIMVKIPARMLTMIVYQ